jgi:hypothetical protein
MKQPVTQELSMHQIEILRDCLAIAWNKGTAGVQK